MDFVFKFWLLLTLGQTLGRFLNFVFEYFSFSFHGTPWERTFQNATSPTNRSRKFQTFPEFSSQWPSQNCVWDFWNFDNGNFNEFYLFSLTWDPMGAKISKRYSSYKSQPKVFKLFLNFPPNGPHKNTLDIFEILSFRSITIFFENFKFTIVAYGEINNLNYLENERS